jgi:hypothetical protein
LIILKFISCIKLSDSDSVRFERRITYLLPAKLSNEKPRVLEFLVTYHRDVRVKGLELNTMYTDLLLNGGTWSATSSKVSFQVHSATWIADCGHEEIIISDPSKTIDYMNKMANVGWQGDLIEKTMLLLSIFLETLPILGSKTKEKIQLDFERSLERSLQNGTVKIRHEA